MDNIDTAPLHPQNNLAYYEVLPFAEYAKQLKSSPKENSNYYMVLMKI